ncbi:hypothetical protein [Hafnia alvei]|uniref:hypothetical protein n=1 Tax=Hafnia alvei TaxID=569 RepID=UPI00345D083F
MTIPYEMIVKRIEKGNSLHEQGKNKESLDIYFSVLDDLRNSYENIYDIDETRWLIRCIYNVYFSLKDYISAEKWAKEVFNCNIPYKATSELINLGKVYVELGLENEAMEQFEKAYQKGKIRAFQGLDNKYLQFYLSHKK